MDGAGCVGDSGWSCAASRATAQTSRDPEQESGASSDPELGVEQTFLRVLWGYNLIMASAETDPPVKVGEVVLKTFESQTTDFIRAREAMMRSLAGTETMRKAMDAIVSVERAKSDAMREAFLASTSLSTKWADQILQMHKVTEGFARPYAEGMANLSLATAGMLTPYAEGMVKLSMVMNDTALHMQVGALGKMFAEAAEQRRLMADVVGMANSYSEMLGVFEGTPDRVLTLPAGLGKLSPLEVELHGDLLQAFSPRESSSPPAVYRTRPLDIESRLSALDPNLVYMLEGARFALQSDNPDKVRQAITSLRELLTHVLHLLAPDEQVLSFTENPADFHEGRPTRRTRIRFICSAKAGDLFEAFTEADIEAAIKVFDLCQRGTHALKQPLTERQAAVLLSRAEGLLNYWVELARGS